MRPAPPVPGHHPLCITGSAAAAGLHTTAHRFEERATQRIYREFTSDETKSCPPLSPVGELTVDTDGHLCGRLGDEISIISRGPSKSPIYRTPRPDQRREADSPMAGLGNGGEGEGPARPAKQDERIELSDQGASRPPPSACRGSSSELTTRARDAQAPLCASRGMCRARAWTGRFFRPAPRAVTMRRVAGRDRSPRGVS